MESSDIRQIVLGCMPNVQTMLFPDKTYAVPAYTWIRDSFLPAHKRYQRWRGLWFWEPAWDCDDFAAELRTHAARCHAKTRSRPEEGLAVAEMWYEKEDGTGHAINVFISNQRGLFFVEPQKCDFICLTQRELDSCWYARF